MRDAARRLVGHLTPTAGVLMLGTALGVLLVCASLIANRGGSDRPAEPDAQIAAAAEPPAEPIVRSTLLDGIAQDGLALGSPRAPVTLVEFADLQCPYCAQWARDVFPALIRDYVRPGRLRLVFRGLAFIGPDSERALRAALAAAERDRLWNVVHGLYENQGLENGGWVTDALLSRLGRTAGLDAGWMSRRAHSQGVERELAAATTAAQRAGVEGTPAFVVGVRGRPVRPLVVHSLDAEAFAAELDPLIAG